MKNRKKFVLAGIALLLVVGILVGGTLMLWSSKTDTAHNSVKMDNCKVALWELGGDVWRANWDGDGTYQPVYIDEGHNWNPVYDLEVGAVPPMGVESVAAYIRTDANGNFTGFNWAEGDGAYIDGRPGDLLHKAPYVKNNGSIPVYLKVESIMSFSISVEDLLKNDRWKDFQQLMDEKFSLTINSVADFESQIDSVAAAIYNLILPYFKQIVLGSNPDWLFLGDPEGSFVYDNGEYKFSVKANWYFVEGDQTIYSDGEVTHAKLQGLTPGGQTDYMFKGIEIPLVMPNAFQDFTFDIDLQAFAIQADNWVADTETFATWVNYFPAGDSGNYGPWGIYTLTTGGDPIYNPPTALPDWAQS